MRSVGAEVDGDGGDLPRRAAAGAEEDEQEGGDPGLPSSIPRAGKERKTRRRQRQSSICSWSPGTAAMRRRSSATARPWRLGLGLGFGERAARKISGERESNASVAFLSPSREQRRPGEGTAASWRGGAMARSLQREEDDTLLKTPLAAFFSSQSGPFQFLSFPFKTSSISTI